MVTRTAVSICRCSSQWTRGSRNGTQIVFESHSPWTLELFPVLCLVRQESRGRYAISMLDRVSMQCVDLRHIQYLYLMGPRPLPVATFRVHTIDFPGPRRGL